MTSSHVHIALTSLGHNAIAFVVVARGASRCLTVVHVGTILICCDKTHVHIALTGLGHYAIAFVLKEFRLRVYVTTRPRSSFPLRAVESVNLR